MSSIFIKHIDKIVDDFKDMDEVNNYMVDVKGASVDSDVLNIIKTADVLNFSYDEFINEIKSRCNVPLMTMKAVILKYLEAAGYDLESAFSKAPSIRTWDEYYYNICEQVGKNSKCFSRHIGTVLVRDKTIISTGYNGPPRGVQPCDLRWRTDESLVEAFKEKFGREPIKEDFSGKCPRQAMGFVSGEGLQWCVAGHAERNALIQAAREGICTKHTTLYMSCGIPCTPCLVEIINAGVEEIVVTKMQVYDISAQYLVDNSDLKVRVFSFL